MLGQRTPSLANASFLLLCLGCVASASTAPAQQFLVGEHGWLGPPVTSFTDEWGVFHFYYLRSPTASGPTVWGHSTTMDGSVWTKQEDIRFPLEATSSASGGSIIPLNTRSTKYLVIWTRRDCSEAQCSYSIRTAYTNDGYCVQNPIETSMLFAIPNFAWANSFVINGNIFFVSVPTNIPEGLCQIEMFHLIHHASTMIAFPAGSIRLELPGNCRNPAIVVFDSDSVVLVITIEEPQGDRSSVYQQIQIRSRDSWTPLAHKVLDVTLADTGWNRVDNSGATDFMFAELKGQLVTIGWLRESKDGSSMASVPANGLTSVRTVTFDRTTGRLSQRILQNFQQERCIEPVDWLSESDRCQKLRGIPLEMAPSVTEAMAMEEGRTGERHQLAGRVESLSALEGGRCVRCLEACGFRLVLPKFAVVVEKGKTDSANDLRSRAANRGAKQSTQSAISIPKKRGILGASWTAADLRKRSLLLHLQVLGPLPVEEVEFELSFVNGVGDLLAIDYRDGGFRISTHSSSRGVKNLMPRVPIPATQLHRRSWGICQSETNCSGMEMEIALDLTSVELFASNGTFVSTFHLHFDRGIEAFSIRTQKELYFGDLTIDLLEVVSRHQASNSATVPVAYLMTSICIISSLLTH